MTTIRLLRSLGLAAVPALGLAGAALAHAHLKAAVPAADGTVAAAPAELALTFSEGVDLRFTGAKVTGPGGGAVATGAPRLGPSGDTVLVVPLPSGLGAGPYRVDWHALAVDGHKTEGTYGFTVKP